MRHVVILAGGGGTRFWPLSTPERPKQFLRLFGRRSLLGDTIARCRGLVPPSRLWIVTNAAHVALTRREAPTIPPRRILGEPVGRNSAAAIALASRVIGEIDPAATLLFLPADAHIPDAAAFRETARVALDAAETARTFVTLGIQPTFPATGYGYLLPAPGPSIRPRRTDGGGYSGPRGRGAADVRCLAPATGASEGYASPWLEGAPGARNPRISRLEAIPLARFVEKPGAAKARRLLRAGALWNAGMFAGRAETFVEAFEEFLPPVARGLSAAGKAWGRGAASFARCLKAAYPTLPSISIDYAVMEHASRSRDWSLLTVPGRFAWSDVGTWSKLYDLLPKDSCGNATRGDHMLFQTRHCLIVAEPGHVVAAKGVRDLVVVRAPHLTLVASMRDSERVRDVVSAIERGRWRLAAYGRHFAVDSPRCAAFVLPSKGMRPLKETIATLGAKGILVTQFRRATLVSRRTSARLPPEVEKRIALLGVYSTAKR